MSPPGRPKGEYRSAEREGTPVSPPGRPKGEYRSAEREGIAVSLPPGRPKEGDVPLGGAARGAREETRMSSPKDEVAEQVPSPCISVCVMDPDGAFCLGCFRTLNEIAAWGMLDADAKRRVLALLPAREASRRLR